MLIFSRFVAYFFTQKLVSCLIFLKGWLVSKKLLIEGCLTRILSVIQKYHTERRLGVWINKISVKGKRDLFTTTQLLAESSQPGGMQTKLRALVILSAVLATYWNITSAKFWMQTTVENVTCIDFSYPERSHEVLRWHN